ncbi:MAG: Sec-independent protein translocase protein TatB [Hyphomonadaceae bacterium]|nr:Sec-independent protein translocase protein TatB [Hyphomonadaceae bacterium]
MLPSLGFNEIVVLGILALVVVGPKDLPLLFRKLGKWTAKLRGMAQEFRTGFDELARQAELDELKKEVDALRRTTALQEIRSEITKPLPTLEDYAGIKSQPAIPPPAVTTTPASEAPVETPAADAAAAGQPADEEAEEKPEGVPEHADVAPIARSSP